jgi:hypothetical protein
MKVNEKLSQFHIDPYKVARTPAAGTEFEKQASSARNMPRKHLSNH